MEREDVKAGLYYRRPCGRVVKVLHEASYNHGSDLCDVVYRYRDGERPTRCEHVPIELFTETFEGPLDWDAALQEFK